MFDTYGDILNLEELCELLKISENTAYRLIRENRIKALRIGKVYKIPKTALQSFIEDECNNPK